MRTTGMHANKHASTGTRAYMYHTYVLSHACQHARICMRARTFIGAWLTPNIQAGGFCLFNRMEQTAVEIQQHPPCTDNEEENEEVTRLAANESGSYRN